MTDRPQDVIGLHFFSPANVMKLLEIVRAEHTADDVVATCMELAKNINKIATLVGVCPGFVGNRILFARQIQANKLVYQGVMPWDVDAAFNAFGLQDGPVSDERSGRDLISDGPKGRPPDNPIRDALCEIGPARAEDASRVSMTMTRHRRPMPVGCDCQASSRISRGPKPRTDGRRRDHRDLHLPDDQRGA